MQLQYLVVGLVAIVFMFFVTLSVGKFQQAKLVQVKIGNATVSAELADTYEKQVRGLMFRKEIQKDAGMLFTFGSDGKHAIWMMNMSIPIDIVWIDSGKKVVHIESNVQPCSGLIACKSYSPEKGSRYVLELSSGYAKKHGIKVGSIAKFQV